MNFKLFLLLNFGVFYGFTRPSHNELKSQTLTAIEDFYRERSKCFVESILFEFKNFLISNIDFHPHSKISLIMIQLEVLQGDA